MLFKPKKVILKNNRECILRPAVPEDAEPLLAVFHTVAQETPYLQTSEEDISQTVEDEKIFIQGHRESPYSYLVVAEADGELAGNCILGLYRHCKTQHRAEIGISLLKKFWGLGIGQAMFKLMEEFAREKGILQLELAFLEGNERGLALYRKMGFEIYAERPRAFRSKDGKFSKEIFMLKALD